MHKGRTYPYNYHFWAVECFFWPGFVPSNLFISCPTGYGSDWDRLSAGLVTTQVFDDTPGTGDITYGHVFSDLRLLRVVFHKTSDVPKQYGVVVRFQKFLQPTIAQNGEIIGPQRTFPPSDWGWNFVSNFPPWSNGSIVPLLIRGATYAELA